MDRYLILNGPNLNLLGTRDPAIYGATTLPELVASCRVWGAELGVGIDAAQSNSEGTLIDLLHDARLTHAGVVFNAGAYTHTSYALHDAIEAIGLPTVEVHISNVLERDPWRRISLIGPACVAAIYGRGIDGYRWGLRHLVHRREWPMESVRYGDHPDAILDIRRPEGEGPHPVVVLVHGGFWRHMWTRDTMEGIAVDLARRGYLTANVEYRRVGTGGGWPQSAQDVAAAIARVAESEHADRMAVIGHSAGAQLALMARAMVDVPYLPILLGGVLDMAAAVSEDLDGGAAAAFLGEVEAAVASPTGAARSGEAVVLHGTADDRVPITHGRAYAAANPDCDLIELADIGHFDFLERSSDAWKRVLTILQDRLVR